MSEYVFEQRPSEEEFLRLQMIEQAADPATIAHLKRAGIQNGWRCLEVGAGAGSIVKGMGRMVGETGRVVAVDRNISHLSDLSDSRFQIVGGDFCNVPLPDAFDLAHCRYVLIHNRTGDAMLERLCNALKPGGVLVVEEPDFTSAKLLNGDEQDSQQRVNNAICRMFDELALDPGYGLTVPEKVADHGLQIVEVDSRIHLGRGGSLMARVMGASTTALADKYIATGEASENDIEVYVQNTNNEQFWSVFYSTVTVIATK